MKRGGGGDPAASIFAVCEVGGVFTPPTFVSLDCFAMTRICHITNWLSQPAMSP